MAMGVHADLDECLRDGTPAARNERILQHPRKIVIRGGFKPGVLLRLNTLVPMHERADG